MKENETSKKFRQTGITQTKRQRKLSEKPLTATNYIAWFTKSLRSFEEMTPMKIIYLLCVLPLLHNT